MTASQLTKRPADDDSELPSAKQTKLGSARKGRVKKTCINCKDDFGSFPAISADCKKEHSGPVCGGCWNRHIAVEVMEQRQAPVKCILFNECGNVLTRANLEKVANKEVLPHYDYLIARHAAYQINQQECLVDVVTPSGQVTTCHTFQAHDVQTQGRVCTCISCGNRTCVPCGVFEHAGEECGAFQLRLHTEHSKEEAATKRAFAEGYTGRELVGKYAKLKERPKRPMPCPRCGVQVERMPNHCKHMICLVCKIHFCSGCGARYFGSDGVYDVGNAAHEGGCTYFNRATEDKRFRRQDTAAVASRPEKEKDEVDGDATDEAIDDEVDESG